MNVTLNEHFQNLINQLVESGEFETQDEVVQAGLYLLEKRQQKLDALRKDIQEGLASGPGRPFDESLVEDIKRRGRERLAQEQDR
jgi:antitoxin ParD1/3/4